MSFTTQSVRKISLAAGALAAALVLSGCSVLDSFLPTSEPVRDAESGEITESQDRADVFQLRVGDCLNSSTLGTEVSSVPMVPCGEPHEDEVFFAFQLDDGEYPGDDAVQTAASETCTPEFESFISMSYDESSLDWWPFTPTADSWSQGDQEVLCVAWDPSGEMITGSLAGSAR